METVATETGTNLWKMAIPSRTGAALKPKLLINGANDRYWTLDALDLTGTNCRSEYLIELPNAGHDLKVNRDWRPRARAFFHHVVLNRPMAGAHLGLSPKSSRGFSFTIRSSPAPQAARDLDSPIREPRLPRIEVGGITAETR